MILFRKKRKGVCNTIYYLYYHYNRSKPHLIEMYYWAQKWTPSSMEAGAQQK
jgi:hypothetical protein